MGSILLVCGSEDGKREDTPSQVDRNENGVIVAGMCGSSESRCAITAHDPAEVSDALEQAIVDSTYD